MSHRFGYLLFITLVLQFMRFPYIFDRGGKGAFLYIYFLTSIVLGGCMLMGELILGKTTGKSLGSSLVRVLNDKIVLDKDISRFRLSVLQVGKSLKYVFLIINFCMVMYLSIVSIWLLHATVGLFFKIDFNAYSQSIFAVGHFVFTYFIYKKQNSLQKIEQFLMAVGVVLIVYLFFNSISILKNNSALLTLFYPDYSQVSWTSLQVALGHTCFSLLLGYGLVSQFGGTLDRNRDVTSLATRLVSLSFLSCIVVTVVSMSAMYGKSFSFVGYKYFIETLPKIFNDTFGYIGLSAALLVVFYVFISVFILRLIRIFRRDINDSVFHQFPKSKNIFYILYVVFTYSLVFFSSQFKHVKLVGNSGFFDIFEDGLITFALPLYMSLVIFFFYFAASKKLLQREFSAIDIDQEISHFYPIWRGAILWLTPAAIFVGIMSYLYGHLI
ncbi:MAG: hypothetical protein IT287_05440 [Bdellovibrionaceae bacterium]|nr:hypothetical protein [Pseudobdellovibrionaceae bacterium]